MPSSGGRKTVADFMVRDVVTIKSMAKLREAMQLMRQRGVKSLVVEKGGPGDAWGLLTYTAVLRAIIQEEGDVDLINVYDIASKPAVCVPRQLEVRHAVNLMLNLGIKRLIVSSNNELEGIVTINDIVAAIMERMEP